MSKRKTLSREYVASLLAYDPESGMFTWSRPRQAIKVGQKAGTRGSNGYIQIRIDGFPYPAHRLAWLLMYGEHPAAQVDHINGIPTDNRICNLRLADNHQNQYNQKLHRDNTSGVKGVCKVYGKWNARISVAGKRKSLGQFETIEEAASAIMAAREQFHGEFCRHS